MSKGAVLVLIGALGLLPVWRCGVREHLTFYEFVGEHTIWGHEVTYIPEELLTQGKTLGIYMVIR